MRRFFIETKTARQKRPYHPNPKWDTPDFWTDVGSLCLEINARPDLFIQAQFDTSKLPDGPYPTALKGPGAKRRYWDWIRIHRPQDRGEVSSSMEVETDEVEHAMRKAMKDCREDFPDEPVNVALRSYILMTPAWLRILLVPYDEEVLQRWGEQGGGELLENPILQRQCQAVDLPVADVLSKLITRFPSLQRK